MRKNKKNNSVIKQLNDRSAGISKRSRNSSEINLTIDSRIQKFASNELNNHKAGSVVVMEVDTGEIDQNREDYSKLVNEIGVNEQYDIPLIKLDLDSLTLTEFIIQIENKYSYEIDISDISEKQLSCNDIYNRIYKINKPVNKTKPKCLNINKPIQTIKTPIKENKNENVLLITVYDLLVRMLHC